MKINFTDYINNLKEQFSITDQEFETELSIFCEANNLTENLNLEFKNRILYADEQNLLKYKKAIEEYVKVLDIRNDDYKSYFKISQLLNDLGKKDEAIQMLNTLIKKKPELYEANKMLR